MPLAQIVSRATQGRSGRVRALGWGIVAAGLVALLSSMSGCRKTWHTTTGVAVTALTWTPRSPKLGQTVVFHATVRNRTNVDIPSGTELQVHFGVDGNEVSTAQITTPQMGPGASLTVEGDTASTADPQNGATPGWIAVAGRHFVVASVDVDIPNEPVVHSLLRRDQLLVIKPVRKSSAIRVMCLGDSITSGNKSSTSYRYFLWKSLMAHGIHNVEFVGSLHGITDGNPPPDNDWDEDHEGLSGWRADEILIGRQNGEDALAGVLGGKAGWMNVYRPDIVIVHLGSNDLEQGYSVEDAALNVGRVIDAMRRINPNVEVVLAQVIPDMAVSSQETVMEFNDLLARMATEKSTPQSPIVPVDLYNAIDPTSDLADGMHLTDDGNRKVADRLYPVLANLIAKYKRAEPPAETGIDEAVSTDEPGYSTQTPTE